MRTPPPPGSGVAYSVTDMYLFWIIAANFVARKAEKDLNDYPSVVKLISDMRGYPEISSIYDAEVSSVQSRFRVCSTLGKGRKSDVSELNTNSPLTGAINQLKLLAAGPSMRVGQIFRPAISFVSSYERLLLFLQYIWTVTTKYLGAAIQRRHEVW